MAEVNVFLDTMVYLHFVPLEQIDLCGVLVADRVIILVPRVTLKELEKHKINHASARSCDRARQALALLEKHVESGSPIRDGVAIAFIPHMPRLDMEQHGLNPLWNDDLLIASVLEYKTGKPSEETLLVTDDTGARLTCRHLGVRTAQLPDKYRLPAELDDDEKEMRRLRRENEKLKNALPKLAIGFGDEVEPVGRFSLRAPETVDEKRIAQTLSKLKGEFPELPEKQTLSSATGDLSLGGLAGVLAAADALGGIPDEEYQRYNKERVAYFDKYERYIRATTEMQNRMARTLRFTVAISNAGSAPADDVDVRLFFPDGFVLCAEDDLPAPPREPKQPVKPRSQMEMITANMVLPNLRMPEMRIPDLGPISSFRLRKTNSYEVSDHFARIKHGQTEELRELFLTFDSRESAASFHCKYEVSVGNLPDMLKGSLHFVIERGGAPTEPADDDGKPRRAPAVRRRLGKQIS